MTTEYLPPLSRRRYDFGETLCISWQRTLLLPVGATMAVWAISDNVLAAASVSGDLTMLRRRSHQLIGKASHRRLCSLPMNLAFMEEFPGRTNSPECQVGRSRQPRTAVRFPENSRRPFRKQHRMSHGPRDEFHSFQSPQFLQRFPTRTGISVLSRGHEHISICIPI